MPMTAMIRNLATMTRVGLIAPGAAATKRVAEQIADVRRLRAARIHPIAVLAAIDNDPENAPAQSVTA